MIFKFLSRTCVSLVFASGWFEKRRGTYEKPEVQKVWFSGCSRQWDGFGNILFWVVFAGRWIEETSGMYSYRLAACGTDWEAFLYLE